MVEMPADFTPLDPGRIEAADPFEIEYWRRELGCSTETLIEVVGRVGGHVTSVRQALAEHPSASQRSAR